jgi:hypothetical protein
MTNSRILSEPPMEMWKIWNLQNGDIIVTKEWYHSTLSFL